MRYLLIKNIKIEKEVVPIEKERLRVDPKKKGGLESEKEDF